MRNVNVTCATNTFSVGGTVTGLLGIAGSCFMNNGGNDLHVPGDGAFAFTEELASDSDYNVQSARGTRRIRPRRAASSANRGTVEHRRDVTSVPSAAAPANFTVGGTITDLGGHRPRASEQRRRRPAHRCGRSSFEFQTAVPSGAPYNVTVAAQPTGPAQQCDAANDSGTVTNANVSSVQINCVTTEFSIGGTVTV